MVWTYAGTYALVKVAWLCILGPYFRILSHSHWSSHMPKRFFNSSKKKHKGSTSWQKWSIPSPVAQVSTRSPHGEVFFLISVHTTPFHFSKIKYHFNSPTWEPFSLLSTDNYPHVDSNSLASGDSSSPWFIEHMFQWPTSKSLITLHYIKLDLDGSPLLSFYVVAPDPSHSGWMAITAKLQWCKPFETNHTLDLDGAPLHSLYVVVPDPTTRNERQITEDDVTTAKLPWCKPLKQCILWITYLRVILPTCLLTTDNYPHANSNSHASVDFDSVSYPWFIKYMVQWANDQFGTSIT